MVPRRISYAVQGNQNRDLGSEKRNPSGMERAEQGGGADRTTIGTVCDGSTLYSVPDEWRRSGGIHTFHFKPRPHLRKLDLLPPYLDEEVVSERKPSDTLVPLACHKQHMNNTHLKLIKSLSLIKLITRVASSFGRGKRYSRTSRMRAPAAEYQLRDEVKAYEATIWEQISLRGEIFENMRRTHLISTQTPRI